MVEQPPTDFFDRGIEFVWRVTLRVKRRLYGRVDNLLIWNDLKKPRDEALDVLALIQHIHSNTYRDS